MATRKEKAKGCDTLMRWTQPNKEKEATPIGSNRGSRGGIKFYFRRIKILMKKKIFSIFIALVLVLSFSLVTAVPVAAAKGGGGGINNPPGNPLFVVIEVTWDGDFTDADNDGSTDSTTWTVWGPAFAPVVDGDTILAQATDCFDMSVYTFTFHGKTVHFDETYVSGVDACPQIHHVVLHDIDGNLVYTGSDPASKYTFPPSRSDRIGVFHDRIDYEITFDNIGGNVTDFHYLEFEHWNRIPRQ